MNINIRKYTTPFLSVAALAMISGHTSAATLAVDFNDNAALLLTQSGFVAATTASTTVTTELGVGGSMTIDVLLEGYDDRDRGALTGGPGLTQSDLLRDFIFRKNAGGLVIQLSSLKAGTYSFTGFFHDNGSNQGTGQLHVDRDGYGVGTLGEEEMVSSFDYSTGTAPTTVGTASFTFDADGINPVAIVLRASSNAHVINGFTVTAVPEPSTAVLLGLGGVALILRRKK